MSEEKRVLCPFCLNARSDPDGELSDYNDLSYLSIGFCDPVFHGLAMYLRSGDGRPVEIVADALCPWIHERMVVASYYPKFCPECGRPLMDDYPEKRSVYGKDKAE